MPGKEILERVFEPVRRRHAQSKERGRVAAVRGWHKGPPMQRTSDSCGAEAAGLMAPFHRSRNAFVTCAFGRRSVSSSEIRFAFALVAMRNGVRAGVLVA